jgi:hypothetical protein
VLAAAAAQGAAATPPAQAAPAPVEAGRPAEGVIVYPPAYFADARPNTAFDMIRRLPGFSFSGGDQVRGFGGAAGNVLIDGQRPASKTDPLSEIIGRIPAADVERIEVVRGGSTGVDMQGYSVVANVVRRRGAKTQGLAAAATNLFPEDQATYSVRLEGSRRWSGRTLEGAFAAGTSVFNGDGADGYRIRRGPAGEPIFDADVIGFGGSESASLRGGYATPLWGGTLRLNGSLAHERPRTSETTIFLPAAGVDLVTFEQPQTSGEAGLNYKRALAPRTEAEGVLLQRRTRFEAESTSRTGATLGLFTEAATSGESIARGIVRFARSETLSFEAGAEGAFNFLDSATAFTRDGAPVAIPNAQVRVEERRGEAFGKATWKIAPKLTLEAGSRFEVSAISQTGDTELEKSFFYPKPRLALTWSPDAVNQFRFRIERSVGQLSFGDFVASAAFSTDEVEAGNADLEPSKTVAYEAVYERRFWTTGALVLTLAHQRITDALDRIPIQGATGVFDAVGNIGDAQVKLLRIDLTVPTDRLRVPRGQLKLYGSWVDVDVTDPTTGEERRASGNSPFIATAAFTQDLPRLRSTWGFDYNSPSESTSFRFNEIRRNNSDAYLTGYFEVKPTPVWAVRFEGQNLLSRGLRREREVYAGPRDENPLSYREVRDVHFPPFLYIRVRRILE